MPARSYLYMLISELEMGLAEQIRTHYKHDEEALREKIGLEDAEYDEQKKKIAIHPLKAQIDLTHFLTLTQLFKIIQDDADLLKPFNFTKKQFKNYLGDLPDFRHDVMHPVRLILNDNQLIERLYKNTERLKDLLERVNQIKK